MKKVEKYECESKKEKEVEFKVGSLFAGVGGIDLGFQEAKYKNSTFDVLWGNEMDKYASETYRTNFRHPLLEGDINAILSPPNGDEKYLKLHEAILKNPVDVLTGGFPCQAFSIAGERRGFEDERGNLFLSFINLAKLLEEKHGSKPRALFMENVKNLKSHDKGRTYKIIKNQLEKSGYTVKEKVLNTMHYTELPQNRERMFITAFREKTDAQNFTFFDDLPKPAERSRSEWEEIVKKIIDYDLVDAKLEYSSSKYPRYFNDLGANPINLTKEVTESYQFYQLRRGMYLRKNKSNVCPTLTANMGTGGHNVPLILTNNGIRKISPQESFKLQGFPIGYGYELPKLFNGREYSNSHLYKQAGNSVSVPLIKTIATGILKAFNESDLCEV